MSTFPCTLVTPEGVLVKNEVWQVAIKSEESSFVVRARHTDLLFAADQCTIEIATTPESREVWDIEGFLFKYSKNRCMMVCKRALKK